MSHKSLLEFEGITDRVIVVDSISKRFSCCGVRIGAIISKNKDVMQAVLKFAALAAYKMGMGYFAPVRVEYQKRRDILYEGLKDVPGVVIRRPEGAFYIIAKLPVKDAEHFTIWMLTEHAVDGKTVMFAPAEGFYGTPGRGRDEVRMAYVLNEHDLLDSIRIFKSGLEKYRKLFP